MTEDKVEHYDSLEGLKTTPSYKVFDVAGHQIVFHYDLQPLDILQNASIYVPGLGRVTYQSKRPCDSYADAQRWLEGLDINVARKTLAFLYGKVKAINR